MQTKPMFIGIAGLIGAGKTTLADALGERLEIDVHHEPVRDNVYLEDFYRDTAKHAFAMQVYLLNRRFQQHQEIIWRARPAIQDRTIYEDAVFARVLHKRGQMDARDYQTYLDLFGHMSNFMCHPTLVVYLDVSPATAMRRIVERERGFEVGIQLSYLEDLHFAYEEFIRELSRSVPVLRVDWETYGEVGAMAAAVAKAAAQMSYLKDLSEVRV